MKLIRDVWKIIKFENQKDLIYMEYPNLDFELSKFGAIHSIDFNVLFSKKKIIYEDGSEYLLPISERLIILEDRTAFLVIFDEEPSQFSKEKEFPWFFDRPNNAAIYNAEGTLRHQLILPNEGFWSPDSEGWYIHSTYYADFPNLKGWGVMVTNDLKWPDLCFCLYDGTPNLVWTKYSQDRR